MRVRVLFLTLATLMEVTGTDEQELVLRQELQLMNGLLKQLSDKLDLNEEMKECRNQMRELTYDIEDY
jgi:molybdopterin converting factor small subunit